MSVQAVVTVLRCDNTRTDPRRPSVEIRCLSEVSHNGDFDATRDVAAQSGWARVRSSHPWSSDIKRDICPVCYAATQAGDAR